MRRVNAIVSMGILVLFLIHGILGGFQLAGILPGGSAFLEILAWVMTALIGVHTVIGVKLTADTLRACKRAGTSYFKENRMFWLRRFSGMAVMVFLMLHIVIFLGSRGEVYRLNLFAGMQLISQLLLVLSVAVHVLTNIKPLMLALGAKGYRDFLTDILTVLSVILLLTGLAFIAYYIRWNTF